MKRAVLLLSVLAGLASQSWAADKTQSVTVAQLGRWLAGAHGQPDGKIAKGLKSMTLTERVSVVQLAQWKSDIPGRHSREELTVLADSSAFLDPAATDVLADAPPDLKAQEVMFSSAIDYVVQTLAKLPDFYATRTTAHFEDTPAHMTQVPGTLGAVSMSQRGVAYVPLHQTVPSSIQVSNIDGAEMHGAKKMDRTAIDRPESGLTTAGEFGPILSVVLHDAIHGTVTSGYWQQSPLGQLAVFRYAVPYGQSNYVLSFKHGIQCKKLFSAYHGEIAIYPATGAILRITVVADPTPSSEAVESAIAVDYGKVQLGSKDYICPLRGVAILKTNIDTAAGQIAPQTQLNDVTFTGYHLARGDVRILPEQP
ncbi:MAG: hypothetical protein P4K94_03910 [Terracidiphilus sp.]|nr:hypothetical protein [Terracidiphilus sp.]